MKFLFHDRLARCILGGKLTWFSSDFIRGQSVLNTEQEFSAEEKRILNLLDKGLSTVFPNPGRVGCPEQSVLRGIAQHEIPLSQADRWLDHLSSCTPCFLDFRKLRAEATAAKRRVFQVALATAAVLLIIIGGLLWLRSRPVVQIATVTMDLRERSVARGEGPSEARQVPLELSRGAKHLILDLPIGSKEGSYEVALLSGSGEQIRSTTGIAQLENHTVILKAHIDFADVSSGLYFLAVRKRGMEWNRYLIRVRS